MDEETSLQQIYDYFLNDWTFEPANIALAVIVDEPRGNAEELAKVKDVLGTFSTSFSTSGRDRSENVTNGCNLISGTTVYPEMNFPRIMRFLRLRKQTVTIWQALI